MNTAICVDAVAESSTIFLSIVTSKHGPLRFSHAAQMWTVVSFNWTISWTIQAFVRTTLFFEDKQVSLIFITRPQNQLSVCLLVLYLLKWAWPWITHDLSSGALFNCEMVPSPSSVISMHGHFEAPGVLFFNPFWVLRKLKAIETKHLV